MLRALTLCLALAACGDDGAAPDAGRDGTPSSAPAAASTTASATASAAAPKGPTHLNPEATRMAASHVLLAWEGALRAPASVTRDQAAAKALAEEIAVRARAGEDFAALAREYSDDSSAARGGSVGTFARGAMVPEFEAAVRSVAPGEIAGPVESPFGYHVVRRDPMLDVRAAHLYVAWAGADRAPEGVTRTREEAQARIEEARARIEAGEDFSAVVALYSDGPMQRDGGDLGWFGRGQLVPELDAPAFELRVGEVTPVLVSPRGFHLLKRTQ